MTMVGNFKNQSFLLASMAVIVSSCASSIGANPLASYIKQNVDIEISIFDLSIENRTPLGDYAHGNVFVIDFTEKNLSEEYNFFDIFYVSGFKHADGIVTEYNNLFIVDPTSDYFGYLTHPLFCDATMNVSVMKGNEIFNCSYEIIVSIEEVFYKEGNFTIGFYTQVGPRSSFLNTYYEDTVNEFLLGERVFSIDIDIQDNEIQIL